ncbi:MAG: PAS domain-containing protein [Balneolaceae bacterium]
MEKIYQIVLIVKHESEAKPILSELAKHDLKVKIDVVKDKKQLPDDIDHKDADLLISYYQLDGFTAYDVLKHVCETNSAIPFFLIFDRKNEITNGFQDGITNYIMKENISQLGLMVKRELQAYEKIAQLEQGEKENEFYKSLLQSVNGIVWEADATTLEFNYVSPKSKDILGYNPSQWYKNKNFWKDRIHPEDLNQVLDYFHVQSQKNDNNTIEYRMITAEGNVVWLRDRASVITKNGEAVKLRGMMLDITKEMKNKRHHELAYDMSEIGHWELDTVSDELYWSPMVKELHEVADNYEPTLESALSFYKNGIHSEKLVAAVNRALETGESFSDEFIIITQKGTERWVRVIGATEFQHDKCIRMFGSTQNITQRKEAEQKLQESLLRYNYVVKSTQDAIYDWDIVKDLFEWEEGFKILFEHESNGIFAIKDWANLVHPDDLAELERSLNNALSTASTNQWESTYRFRKADGTCSHVSETGYIIRNVDGQAVRMIGSLRDMTEKFELEQLLESAQSMAHIGAWEVHLEKEEAYWSPITREIHEADPDFEVDLEKSINFYKKGKSRDAIKNVLSKAIENGASSDVEVQLVTAKGNEKWVRVKAETTFVDGKCIRLYGSIQDIQERKEAQLKIKKAYEEREQILWRITDGFFAVDKNWKVTYWNRKAEEILGKGREEIIGGNLWEVFEDIIELDFYDQYHKAIEKQMTVHFKEFYPGKNIWLEVSAYPSSAGLSVYFKDITEQKNSELQLQESLKEKETLLIEIHHRVKNNLAMVSGMLQIQSLQEDNKYVVDKLSDSIYRIKTMALIHELLYKSSSFTKLNVSENIKQLISTLTELFVDSIDLDIHYKMESIELNINQAIPFMLMLNEIVTNILKHAFERRNSGEITVELFEKAEALTVKISDNGNGLPKNFSSISTEDSVGLTLIDILANQLEGDYNYQPLDPGSMFKLTFKRRDVKGIGNANL